MSRRKDVPQTSSLLLRLRVSPDELERAKTLAMYLGMTLSDLVRSLLVREESRAARRGAR